MVGARISAVSFIALACVSLPVLAQTTTSPPILPLAPEAPTQQSSAAQPFTPVPPASELMAQNAPDEVNRGFIDALTLVYQNHPQLQAQRQVLEATDEGVSQALSGFRPDISANYDRGRQRSRVGLNERSYQNTDGRSVSVIQDVFNGGESLASFREAKARVKAARAELMETEQRVLYNAISAYAAVVENTSVLGLNQNNVDVLRRQLQAAQERFDVGELTQTDVAQAQARLAQAEADERQALGALEAARATFRRVMGFDAPGTLSLPAMALPLPQTQDEALSLAGQLHPSLARSAMLEKAAQSNVSRQKSALLPDVYVQALSSRSEGGSASGVRRFESDEITLNVAIPLYQSGAEWSRVRQAKSEAQQAKYVHYDTRDAVTENVARVWQNFATAQAVIASTEEAVRAAELALEGVKQENQYGERTMLDVLNAEQELFSAKVSLVHARVDEKLRAFELLAAVGRLNAKTLQLPVALYDDDAHYDDVKYKLIGF